MQSDIEIARAHRLAPIGDIAQKLGIGPDHLSPYGRHIAKTDLNYLESLKNRPDGKLILVTAISPTPAGEGKTTTTVGLGDALNQIGHKALICLREPSLGPCFGMKGGAAGGGYAQVVPMVEINLHFTGDFHAITAANNLLSALIDNHIHWGNALNIDTRRIVWRRCLDLNDRALRQITAGLGGVSNGYAREDSFDITVASEVMAIFCLATSLADLEARLGAIIVAYTRDRKPVYARDLAAPGAMTVLLKEALAPNLVQTLAGNPALVHGGPFANIAHGCNSVIATQYALKMADFVVTEAGFGADLGAEKFFDIKCRKAGLKPSVAVVVATIRALKMHGGVAREALTTPNLDAVRNGIANLDKHVENIKKFGVPAIVAINHFASDSAAEEAEVISYCREKLGIEAIVCKHFAEGAHGATSLAKRVAQMAQADSSQFKPLYPDDMPLWDKLQRIAREIYGAAAIEADDAVRANLNRFEKAGYGHLPVCIAKTQYSFSTDPSVRGAPSGHTVVIKEVMLSAGAGFVVAVCGDIMRMPGLPKSPAAERIHIDAAGHVEGLF